MNGVRLHRARLGMCKVERRSMHKIERSCMHKLERNCHHIPGESQASKQAITTSAPQEDLHSERLCDDHVMKTM